MARVALAALLLALALSLSGCGEQYSFHGVDIRGKDYGRSLQLTDQFGQPRSLADFKGKVVAVFFGYTFCPDVCPTNLALFKTLLARLGRDADRLAVVFVTVDPERDSAERLKMYMAAFDERFIGLRGTPQATAQIAKSFNVFYQKQGDVASGHYSVDHTANTFLFDPQGQARVLVRYGETAERLESDIRQLLAGH